MLGRLLLLGALVGVVVGFHCENDEDLGDVSEYKFTLPHDPSDLDYWKNTHLNMQLFGSLEANPGIIKVDYRTEGEKLIYGLTVDCGDNTWSTRITSAKGEEVEFRSGSLEEPSRCEAEGTFDVWLKIQQPHLMNFIFNGQALKSSDEAVEHKIYKGPRRPELTRERPGIVPTSVNSRNGDIVDMKASGSAVLSRFTFGKCTAWPKGLNCLEAKEFVVARSKRDAVGYSGMGQFGANHQLYGPRCLSDTKYFNFIQGYIHPDENSMHRNYCCCVNMITGWYWTDVDTDCAWKTCSTKSCSEAAIGQIKLITDSQNIANARPS